jgi:RimJ/RimL family protein N-acetyltransferase
VIVLRELSAEDWADWRELRLAALREAPHAFGAKLADWQGAGDTEHRWRHRLDGGSLNLLAAFDGTPAGMAGGMPPDRDGTVELISMWIAPFARGRGVGDALVTAVVQWAEEQGARRVALRVFTDNRHAANLYLRHGFLDRGAVGRERRLVREAGVS